MNFLDHEELAERGRRQRRKQKRDLVWNVLTGLAIIGIVSLVGIFALIFSNPTIGLNPLPPPTMPVLVDLSTPTATLFQLPPTWTATIGPTGTPRPEATSTEMLPTVATATIAIATQAPATPRPTSDGLYPFALESAPIAMASTVFHTDGDCNWQGVAGRVVDLKGSPVPNIRVRLKGIYNGKSIDMTTLTGLAAAWYGESGFEFQLGTKPIASTALLAIQLEDQSFLPLSDQVILDTYSTCDKNLILVNFKQVR